jgi:8-oxo-dGTP diphosphatase
MTVVVAAIIQDALGIFCDKRGEWKSLPGKWEFPGGKAKLNEPLDQAIKREIAE